MLCHNHLLCLNVCNIDKLQGNQFIYDDYNDNSLIGFNGILTSGSCYINNGNIHTGMTLQHDEYTSNDSNVYYVYNSQPVNSLIILRGYDAKIAGIGGGPQGVYNNCFLYIPANKSGTINFTQPNSLNDFYVDRVLI